MSKTKIIRYTITCPGYERCYIAGNTRYYRTFETAKTMKQAVKKAHRMGDGAEIEQVSVSRSGKIKVKVWSYVSPLRKSPNLATSCDN